MALDDQLAVGASQNEAATSEAAQEAIGKQSVLSPARRRATMLTGFMSADALAAALSASLALWLHALATQSTDSDGRGGAFWNILRSAAESAFLSPGALQQILVLTLVTLLALSASGLYTRTIWELDEGRRALTAGLIVFMISSLPRESDSLPLHGLSAIVSAGFLAMALTTLRMAVRATPMLRRASAQPTILVGDGLDDDGFNLHVRESRGPREAPIARLSMKEFLSLTERRNAAEALAERIAAPLQAITVVLAPSPKEMAHMETALEAATDLGLSASLALPSRLLARRRLAPRQLFAGDMTLLDLDRRQNSGKLGRALKRAFDVAASGLALIALSPLLIGVMLALKWSYGWDKSIFFSQRRVGKDRVRFDCLKFRTMAPDAEERLQALLAADPEARKEWDTYQKLSRDPRITPVGHFLRKTSLDELPQLVNVLRGDMSLVGPRPIVAPELKGYVNDAAYYDSPEFEGYAALRPGVTGLWQVSGRASTAYSERMRLDAWYADNWSLWLDVLIILKTARAAILGSGAS